MSNFRWTKTDTASIMFTCLSSKKWGRSFRLAATLKSGDISPELLSKAATDIMPRYPSMHAKIRKGFFWNYQQYTDSLPEIREENSHILAPIAMRDDATPDFRLVYYKNRLAIEAAHHLGDGKGVSEYFTALLERYTELCQSPESEYNLKTPSLSERANSYADYYIKGGEKPTEKEVVAHKIKGEIEKGFMQLVFVRMSVEEIYSKAKSYGVTVTEFLAACLILGTIKNEPGEIKDPIVIAIPVNLRRFFPSDTVRNFTVQTKLTFDSQGRKDWTISEITQKISGQIKKNTRPEELQKQLNKFGDLVNNPVLRIVPNFIKQPVLRSSQRKTHSTFTTILTNVGATDFSPRLANNIACFDCVNGDTSGYGLISTCSAMSCNGILSLCFSICSHDTSWARTCVRIISSENISIKVDSTHGNGEKADEM